MRVPSNVTSAPAGTDSMRTLPVVGARSRVAFMMKNVRPAATAIAITLTTATLSHFGGPLLSLYLSASSSASHSRS